MPEPLNYNDIKKGIGGNEAGAIFVEYCKVSSHLYCHEKQLPCSPDVAGICAYRAPKAKDRFYKEILHLNTPECERMRSATLGVCNAKALVITCREAGKGM